MEGLGLSRSRLRLTEESSDDELGRIIRQRQKKSQKSENHRFSNCLIFLYLIRVHQVRQNTGERLRQLDSSRCPHEAVFVKLLLWDTAFILLISNINCTEKNFIKPDFKLKLDKNLYGHLPYLPKRDASA